MDRDRSLSPKLCFLDSSLIDGIRVARFTGQSTQRFSGRPFEPAQKSAIGVAEICRRCFSHWSRACFREFPCEIVCRGLSWHVASTIFPPLFLLCHATWVSEYSQETRSCNVYMMQLLYYSDGRAGNWYCRNLPPDVEETYGSRMDSVWNAP